MTIKEIRIQMALGTIEPRKLSDVEFNLYVQMLHLSNVARYRIWRGVETVTGND